MQANKTEDRSPSVEDMDGGELLDHARSLVAGIRQSSAGDERVLVRGHYDRLETRAVAVIQDADSFAEVWRAASALADAALAMSEAAGEEQ